MYNYICVCLNVMKLKICMFIIGIGCDLDFLNKQLHVYLFVFFISDKLNQGEGSVSSVVGDESGASNSNKDTGKININHQKV